MTLTSGDEERVPCDDELCVGIIGPDGRCGTCGRAGSAPPLPAAQRPPEPQHADPIAAAPEGDERVPCRDDLCVGIVGADGRCGTCGRPG